MNLHQRFVSFCSVKRMLINLAAVMFLVTQPVWPQSPQHPLDGLTAPEIWTAYEVLQASHKVGADTRFPMVQLHEPPKEEVLAWKPRTRIHSLSRSASVTIKFGS
jgi:primary-amine oxidase